MSDDEFMSLVADANSRLDRINSLLEAAFQAHMKHVHR